jgi:hypothetical protein
LNENESEEVKIPSELTPAIIECKQFIDSLSSELKAFMIHFLKE